jgi:hypothetical protein
MMLAAADGRPAHLTRVHRALTSLPEDDQRRLGVTAGRKNGPHRLTYRQAEYTFGLVTDALGKDEPDGLPSGGLAGVCGALLEASVPREFKDAGTSLAVDWTDLASFSRPPPHGTSDCAGPEASWGHRKNNLLHGEDELFFGYAPPEHPRACCTQQTITVPAGVNAKTRHKHDYPAAAWRRSYARRTAAGLPPRTRRRRKTLTALTSAGPP